jgi:hypothetical protein
VRVSTQKDFASWYDRLPDDKKSSFARRAKTTRGYIESHLLAPYKIPRAEAMNNLAAASGEFSVAELAAWFYQSSLVRKGVKPEGRAA